LPSVKTMKIPAEILVLKHIEIEGPGSIGEFFKNTSWNLKIVDLSKGESLPGNFRNIRAIISLGGPMNAYEEDKYSFLKDETEFLQGALRSEIPILGICLGAQLLARACGAKIGKAPVKEIGWHKISLTEAGKSDPLFIALPNELEMFQWHEDTFGIPHGAAHLAESKSCPNQAFRFGKNAYGIQFHAEVNPEMIESWIIKYAQNGAPVPDAKDMIIESYKRKQVFERHAAIICLNFARIIAASQIN